MEYDTFTFRDESGAYIVEFHPVRKGEKPLDRIMSMLGDSAFYKVIFMDGEEAATVDMETAGFRDYIRH